MTVVISPEAEWGSGSTPHRKGATWTAEEDETVRANYRTLGLEATALLVGHTRGETYWRARKLKATARAWSEQEDRRLEMLWGDTTIVEIAKITGRSEYACMRRARRLGLGVGVPDGMEYLDHAAKRAGVAKETLAGILRWYGIKPRPTTWTSRTGATAVRRVVNPEDVDEAVAAWTKSETIFEGANRHGIDARTLMRYLESIGLNKPGRRGSKKAWRLTVETIDRAVQEGSEREHLFEAAKRVGIDRETLRNRLLKAGLKPATPRRWFLEPGMVDRVVAGHALSA